MSLASITRRDALFLLGATAVPRAHAQAGILRPTRIDHVALSVGDINKSLAFYRRLFGNEVLKDRQTERRYLRLGPCYIAIAPAAAGEAKRIDHFSVGIENFNAATMRSTLEKAGLKVVRESNVGLFLADPDGVSVQIYADQSWKLLSNAAPEAFPKQDQLFHATGMHHLAVQTSDMAKSTEFYRKLFGEPEMGLGTPPQPGFTVGETHIVLYNPAPNKPPKIDHFSALVDNFDAPSSVAVLKSLGANVALSNQGTLNEFFDPEGIRLQVTFPGQTYGAPTKK